MLNAIKNHLKLALKINSSKVEDIKNDQYCSELKALVKRMLMKKPAERPTAKEILNEPILAAKAPYPNHFLHLVAFNK